MKIEGPPKKLVICTVSDEFDAEKALAAVKEAAGGKFANSEIVN